MVTDISVFGPRRFTWRCYDLRLWRVSMWIRFWGLFSQLSVFARAVPSVARPSHFPRSMQHWQVALQATGLAKRNRRSLHGHIGCLAIMVGA